MPRTKKKILLKGIGVTLPELVELFDHIEGVGFWVKDSRGTFVWANNATMLAMGNAKLDRGLVAGRRDEDFTTETMANQYRLDDEKVLRGVPIISRVELIGQGTLPGVWHATTKIPLRNAAGRVVGTAGISRALPGKLPAVIQNSPVSAAIVHISRNYAERISNSELAKVCGLSERAFQRRFNEIYNCSPHKYLRTIRVRLSCNALGFSNKPITEIALSHGFADQSHFTKEFHRIMDETPRAYRVRIRKARGEEKGKLAGKKRKA